MQTEVPAKGHIEVIDKAVEATCTTKGKTEGKHCVREGCGKVLVAQKDVNTLGHKLKDATCTEPQVCTTCNNIFSFPEGHKSVRIPEKQATCTENGLTEGIVCAKCDYVYLAQKEIPKVPHQYETFASPATFTKDGNILTQCQCGEIKDDETISHIETVSLLKSTFVYNGKAKNPTVSVKDSTGEIIPSEYYTVKKSLGRKNVGKYAYTVTFKGNYEGTTKLTFTIKPAKPAIQNPKSSKKAITVKWKKVSRQSTGYQIMLATNQKFTKNTMWKQNGKESYQLVADGNFKGKYIIKAGKEQFILRLRKISLQRYLKKYAVLRVEAENYFYPGIQDRERINELAAELYAGNNETVDGMELKLKEGKQAYSLAAVPKEGNENQLWLNGLLSLGGKKKKEKKALVLTAMKEQMHCVENTGIAEESQLIQIAVIRDGVFRKIEDAAAKAIRPEKSDRPAGSLLKRQKKALKELFELYRYMVVSFGESYEASQKAEKKQLWTKTEQSLGTKEVTTRLDRKFGMFF